MNKFIILIALTAVLANQCRFNEKMICSNLDMPFDMEMLLFENNSATSNNCHVLIDTDMDLMNYRLVIFQTASIKVYSLSKIYNNKLNESIMRSITISVNDTDILIPSIFATYNHTKQIRDNDTDIIILYEVSDVHAISLIGHMDAANSNLIDYFIYFGVGFILLNVANLIMVKCHYKPITGFQCNNNLKCKPIK